MALVGMVAGGWVGVNTYREVHHVGGAAGPDFDWPIHVLVYVVFGALIGAVVGAIGFLVLVWLRLRRP
jgi:hypothetical protein